MNTTGHTFGRQQDTEWADTFAWHAAWATAARKDDIRRWIEVVHEAVIDSGSTAEELFGPARDAAETFARDLPPEQRAAADLDESTWSSLPRTLLVMTGWFLLALGLALFSSTGWSVDVTLPAVAVFVALLLASSGLGTAGQAWVSGRPAAAGAWALVSVAFVAVVVFVAMQVLDRDRTLGSLPTVVLPALGALLLVLWWNLPERAPTVDDRSRDWPADRWFSRLEWLLRGRHKMPRATAHRLTAETRTHVQETGEHPFEAFGAPQVHALALADADLRTPTYRGRSERRWHLLFSLFAVAVVATDVVSGSVDWSTWVLAAGGILAVALALTTRTTPSST